MAGCLSVASLLQPSRIRLFVPFVAAPVKTCVRVYMFIVAGDRGAGQWRLLVADRTWSAPNLQQRHRLSTRRTSIPPLSSSHYTLAVHFASLTAVPSHSNSLLTQHIALYTRTHTHTRLRGLPGWAGTRKVNQSRFYWSKRLWVAVASAGPYASLHLAPDR